MLTQGTGEVSLAAIQFAVAAGAMVVATTSSEEKALRLKKMGVQHVINYKTTPEWGQVARSYTRGGRGVDHVIEVGGPGTMAESLKAVRKEGIITVIGFLGGTGEKGREGTEYFGSVGAYLYCRGDLCWIAAADGGYGARDSDKQYPTGGG